MAMDELERQALEYLVSHGVLCEQNRQVALSVMAVTGRLPADGLRKALSALAQRGAVTFRGTPAVGRGDVWVCITPDGRRLLRDALKAAEGKPAEEAGT